MKVHEVMTTLVGIIAPESSIVEAARKMKNMNVGVLPVYHKNELAGIVTDRDIVIRSAAEGYNPHIEPVEKIMTRSVEFVLEDDEVETAAKKMQRRQVRRLPVLNSKRMIVGILSVGDLAGRCDTKLAGDTLSKICNGTGESTAGTLNLD